MTEQEETDERSLLRNGAIWLTVVAGAILGTVFLMGVAIGYAWGAW